jgi:hypothetical protein
MRSRNQNQSESQRGSRGSSPTVSEGAETSLSRDGVRTTLLFWFFWSVYLCLSVILVAALLTDWPEFLHDNSYYFK